MRRRISRLGAPGDTGTGLSQAPDEAKPFGAVPGVDPQIDLGLLGLAVDARGNMYGAVVSKAAQGVWRFDRRSGMAERLQGTAKIGFPNSLAFDRCGNLYVTS